MYVDSSSQCNDLAFNIGAGTSTVTRSWTIKETSLLQTSGLSFHLAYGVRHSFEFVIHVVASQNVTNKSFLVCMCYLNKKENMYFGSPSDSWDPCGKARPSYIFYIIRGGEPKLLALELISVFHHLPIVGPKQFCALVHLTCTRKASTS